jgi:hypothetical protein
MEHFPDAPPLADVRERARFRQQRGRTGVGIVVQQAVFTDEPTGRRWTCLATDGQRFRHLDAVVPGVSPFAGIPTGAVEAALEARAGNYPARARLAALVNASPVELTLAEVGGEQ